MPPPLELRCLRTVSFVTLPPQTPTPPTQAVAPADDFPLVALPRQSHEVQHEAAVRVRAAGFALLAQRLPAVVRIDDVRRLGLAEVVAAGGARCVLAERLLPEVAYKLGRAPKYGA